MNTSSKPKFFLRKIINLELHGLKNIHIGYVSTEGVSKIFLDMLIGRQNADMYQIFKEIKVPSGTMVVTHLFVKKY